MGEMNGVHRRGRRGDGRGRGTSESQRETRDSGEGPCDVTHSDSPEKSELSDLLRFHVPRCSRGQHRTIRQAVTGSTCQLQYPD
ncbi:hypothetical protein GCM10010521_40840 [Streptomyces rameus]|uniref:Uncharacterized protein n=1 Tax=Streptomyces rameus TaxID=68261 RepID=A0ABP6NI75_9ACTN